jgi:uncharacterized membrane protein HdeD (DUF308 family)
MLGGFLSLVLSGFAVWLLLTRPVETILAMGWVIGGYAACLGVFLILLGLRFRRNQTECEAESAGSMAEATS